MKEGIEFNRETNCMGKKRETEIKGKKVRKKVWSKGERTKEKNKQNYSSVITIKIRHLCGQVILRKLC